MKAKGSLKIQSKVRYFVLIEGIYNDKGTQLKNIPVYFNLIENLDGKEVEVEYQKVNGEITIISIVCEGTTYKKEDTPSVKNMENKNRGNRHKSFDNSDRGHSNSKKPKNYTSENQAPSEDIYSKTPYNFVPLNENILLQSIFHKEKLDDKPESLKPDCTNNQFSKEKYTGSIKISIENETPLFIGAYKKESKVHRGFSEIEPYKINGKPAIPGSSIRGMLYSLIEVFGFGPMVNLVDKPVYFRSTILDFQNQTELRFGVLSYEQGNYKIYDFNDKVEKLDLRIYHKELQLIDDVNYLGLSSGKIMKRVHSFGVSKSKLDFNKCKVYDSLSIKKVIEDYKFDANRSDQIDNRIDILKYAKDHIIKIKGTQINGCPIWFGVEGDEIKSIGHAKYHRIPAQNRTIDLLPTKHREAFNKRQREDNKQPYELSLAERIFGTSEFRATKVRIEDATSKNASLDQQHLLKSLQSPKIKSANLYLEAPNEEPDWQEPDSGQKLRGFKMYYNKSDGYIWYDSIAQRNDFMDDESFRKKLSQQKKLQSLISPINPKAWFETYIHFTDLTNYELGALLFSLQLPDGLRHSLGMGKPYGLGRVKIDIEELKRFNIKMRYSSDLQSGESLLKKEEIQKLINDFEKFILDEIGEKGTNNLWEVDRFQNAYGLMQLRNNQSDDVKSEYMNLNSFKQKRPIINDPKNLTDYKIEEVDFLKK